MTRSVALHGNSIELAGDPIEVGVRAPNAKLRKDLATDFNLSEGDDSARIYSVVPSLDTPVCAQQTKRFNAELAALGDLTVYTISCDLPVAMARFCGAEGIDTKRIQVLSDHKYLEFGNAYGTLLPALRVLCRAVFVIDNENIVRYAEYVPEISELPDYTNILDCVKSLK